jgi:hypothetical protein
MSLPEQIRRQTEAVQELYKQLNPDDNTGTSTPSTDGTVPPVENADNQNQADASFVANNTAPAPVGEHKPGADNVPEETVVQKYKTLQGMYNAEVPRLHQQNREMQQRLQQMEQLIASMTAAQPPATPVTVDKLVTEQEVADYGESIDVMRKVTREELGAVTQRITAIETMMRQMQTQVVPQVQAVAHRQQLSAEQQFWADLSGAVPNFRQINDTPDFQSWLLSTDPLTGIVRQTYLDDAQRALDAMRVAAFFRTWLETTGQVNVAQSNSTVPAATSELERQVAPGRSRSGGTPPLNNKAKTYTGADIQKFFSDVRKGVYKGREAERDRIERDIFAAQRENRIQVNA